MMRRTVLVIGILIFIIEACIPATTPTLAPTATARLTLTALPTITRTPTLLPTDTPTALPTITQTPTVLPTDTPTSTAEPQPSETQPPVPTPTFSTPTVTEQLTLIAPPTSTPTPTATFTLTPTPTPTVTPTSTVTLTSTKTPTPTVSCQTNTASLVLSVSAESLKVGDTVKVTATLTNEGCAMLGLPKYGLHIQSDGPESIFSPANPQSVVHYRSVAPGQSDTVEFDLKAVASGQATLTSSASFEVHLGYPGPAYWGSIGSREPLIITVAP